MAKTSGRRLDLPDGHYVIMDGVLRMKDARQLIEVSETGRLWDAYPNLIKLFSEWDYTGEDGKALDPNDPDSLAELTLEEFNALFTAVLEEMASGAEKN